MVPSIRAARRGTALIPACLVLAASFLASVPAAAQSPMASMAPMSGPSTPAMAAPSSPPGPGEPGFVAGTKAAPRTIVIDSNDDLLFAPNFVHVQEGETIHFEIVNVGTAVHEFKVGKLADVFGDQPAAPEAANIQAGATATLDYTFDGAGPYAYACHQPGHFQHGMVGYVLMSGPDVPAVGTAQAPRQVLVQMTDQLAFVPNDIPVKQGETVQFIVANSGSTVMHEFQLGPADMVAADKVDGGKTLELNQIDPLHVQEITYTFDGPGPYAFACHQPGHYEAGMKGTITVTS
jgi:uncharacterized cupredoxin-like copper-binding protein